MPSGLLLSGLRRARDRQPERVAVRCGTPEEGWVETTWAQLYDAARSVAARSVAARAHATGATAPVVVVVDGTAESIATMVGLVAAGVDVLLLEADTTYLSDPGPPRHPGRPRVGVGAPRPARPVGAGRATPA